MAIAVVLAGCAVGGAIGAIGVVGVLVGLLIGRRLREMPRVRCVASDWDMKIYGETGPLGRLLVLDRPVQRRATHGSARPLGDVLRRRRKAGGRGTPW
jgi:hypothetical protein